MLLQLHKSVMYVQKWHICAASLRTSAIVDKLARRNFVWRKNL